ncbi:MAG TPA: hypothetical protein VK926_08280 [Gaiellaceae bacterium]|nr:hypothetical protein [Gaiellaceae bacterium]
MGDVWEDEGYAGEDDWGAESVEADLEEELLAPNELEADEEADADDDLDEPEELP